MYMEARTNYEYTFGDKCFTIINGLHGKRMFKPAYSASETSLNYEMSRDMRFLTMWYVRPGKGQTSLRIPTV